jgi:hypothetical protein
VRAFVDGVLQDDVARQRGAFAPGIERHSLNHYIEAQVHGVVSLAAASKRYGFEAEWHQGSVLAPSDVPRDVPDSAETELMRWQAFCAEGRGQRGPQP